MTFVNVFYLICKKTATKNRSSFHDFLNSVHPDLFNLRNDLIRPGQILIS